MKYKGIIAISVLFLAQSFSMQSADDAAFEADLAAAMAASLETAQEERDRAFASASIKPGPRSQRSQTAESRYEPSVRPIGDLVAVRSLTPDELTAEIQRLDFLVKSLQRQIKEARERFQPVQDLFYKCDQKIKLCQGDLREYQYMLDHQDIGQNRLHEYFDRFTKMFPVYCEWSKLQQQYALLMQEGSQLMKQLATLQAELKIRLEEKIFYYKNTVIPGLIKLGDAHNLRDRRARLQEFEVKLAELLLSMIQVPADQQVAPVVTTHKPEVLAQIPPAIAAPAVVAAAAATYRPAVPMTGREQAWQDYGQPAYQPGGAAAMAAPAAAAERNIKKRGRTTFNDDVVWLVNAGASEKNFVIHEIDGRVNLCLPADGAAMLVYDGRGLNKSNLKQFLNEYLQDYLKGFSVWNKHLNRFMTYQELKSYILSCLSTVIDIDQATLRSFLE